MTDNLSSAVLALLLILTLAGVLFLVDSVAFKYFFFASVSMIGGLTLTVYATNRLRLGKQSRSWRRTTGTITKTRIKTLRLVSFDNPEDGPRPFFVPNVQYTYDVSGRAYQSAKISLDAKQYLNADRSAVQSVLGKYAAGSQVAVYYQPKNPALAVLERGYTKKRSEGYVVLLLEGLILIAFGIGILAFKYSIYA